MVRYSCARWIGIAGLEADDALPAAFGERGARIGGVECQLREGRLRPLEHRHAPGQVLRLLRVQPCHAGMRLVGGAEAVLGLAVLVVVVDLGHLEHGELAAALVGERDATAGRRLVHRQADRQRPGQTACEPHLLDHALVVLAAHEALERRESARGEHVQIGYLARGQGEDLERVEVVRPLARAIDERPAVRLDQRLCRDDRAHARTSAGTSRSSSSLDTIAWAASSGSSSSVSTTSSGACGSSYGSSTPVKPLISPLKAFSYRPLDVALRALVDRCLDEHLHERAPLLDQPACLPPGLLVRRDRGRDHGTALTGQAGRDPADSLDVRVAVLLREPEPLGQMRADGVAVQVLDDLAAPLELGPDEVRDGRLARAGQPCEPEREAAFAACIGLGVVVGVDVLSHSTP